MAACVTKARLRKGDIVKEWKCKFLLGKNSPNTLDTTTVYQATHFKKVSPEMVMHSSLSKRLQMTRRSNHKSTHTSEPGILYRLPGRRWWYLWSSDLVLLLSVPRHQLGKRSCSVQFCISWGPALRLWSKWTGKHIVFTSRKGPFLFQLFNVLTIFDINMIQILTIRSQACLPSIKPFGIALGVRISYL